MAHFDKLLKSKQKQELLARLTAPQHIVQNQFTEHQKIEGYFQNRSAADFCGCDRLMKIDTLYGTIQLGYDPKRGQSFLFSNIKTSIFDRAFSSDQRQMQENRMMKTQKTGNQNLAFSSRRRENSATLLYKMENKPWSEFSVAPYLNRANLEALRKTMPFLKAQEERRELETLQKEQKALSEQVRQALVEQPGAVFALRAQEQENSRQQEQLHSLLFRKSAQSRLFFRKINMAFDLQKSKLFDYYRKERIRRALEADNAVAPTDTDTGDRKNHDKPLHNR